MHKGIVPAVGSGVLHEGFAVQGNLPALAGSESDLSKSVANRPPYLIYYLQIVDVPLE